MSSSSNRQSSLSPGERQSTKSRSSSRSHRTTPHIIVPEEDTQHEKPTSRASKRNTRETKPSESSASNPSTNPSSPTSKKQRSSTKSSPSTRKGGSKKKKNSVSTSDPDNKPSSPPNDSQRQDLSFRGLLAVPGEIFQRKFSLLLKFYFHFIV